MKTTKWILILITAILLSHFRSISQVTNSSYVSQYGEKVLKLSITVPLAKTEVWKLFTTDKGLQRWIAPVAKIDMKMGGCIKTNYDISKSIEDSSSIKLDIINYLENEMLTLKVNLNKNFPIEAQREDKNLQEIIQLLDMGNGETKIISTMVGWGKGSHWDVAYNFFEKGNEWTFNEILNLFKKQKD